MVVKAKGCELRFLQVKLRFYAGHVKEMLTGIGILGYFRPISPS